MNPIRLLRQLLALALGGLLAFAVLQGCSANPDKQDFANPFDPDNPESADPFNLEAVQSEAQIVLGFDMIDGHGFVNYYPQHRVEGDLVWTNIDTLTAATGRQQYPFSGATPTAANYFRIMARDQYGRETSGSTVVPVRVDMPPTIANLAGTGVALSRFQTLLVAATAGDTVEVSLDELFATIDASAPRSESGVTEFADFDLGPADPGATITVYARTRTDLGSGLPPILSGHGSRGFRTGPAATIVLAAGGTTIPSTRVDLLISNQGAGVDSMRFASAVDSLWTQEWQPGAATADDVRVLDTVASQTIYANFKRDFGYRETATLAVIADDLATADFLPDLPGNRVSETPAITLLHDAVALEMRSSQYPDFNDAPWVAYADTSVLVLTAVEEQHLYPLFTQYRNHWFESPVRSDFALLGPGVVRVLFTHPLQDLIIEGGTTIEITGTAATFDAAFPVTEVALNLSDDGGWQPATGTENWEFVWDVPLLTADSRWSMGALATATNASGQFETGFAWISVTISQLSITINAPADASEVPRGLPVGISGTATPFLAGAPLDSVVVQVLDQRLASPTLETWAVNWIVPTESADLIDVVAWAYAGQDSVSQRVQVSAVTPGR